MAATFQAFDQNHDGVITREEFARAMGQVPQQQWQRPPMPAPNVAMMVGAAASQPPPVTQSMPQGLPPGAMHPAAMRPAHAMPCGVMPGGHCAMAPQAMPGAMPQGAMAPQMAGVPMPAIPLHTSTAPVMLQGHAPSQPAATMPLRPPNYGVPPMAPPRPAVTASPYLQASGLGAPMASQIPGTMGDLGISEKIAAASTVVRTAQNRGLSGELVERRVVGEREISREELLETGHLIEGEARPLTNRDPFLPSQATDLQSAIY
mgnify:CR=1 FL=1|eukprot:symbB.v1.2.002296.t1/scaffold107.1/size327550/12